ncbi:MAG: beta-lactamase family protein [Steroidobacter sp.]|nr:beta-lactamase family protein [Steroidobacter sp.]
MTKAGTPSVAISVAQHGKILWEEGFGWADRENRVPATPHTVYLLASTSKPITATGLMVLVEAGKVELDRPIDDYLGPVRLQARIGDATQATVRRVANHTAGLPMHHQIFYSGEPRPAIGTTLQHYGNLITAPGERFEYSNLGYGALEAVIAQVSEQPFDEFMRARVFAKLGMTHTSVGRDDALKDYIAVAYDDTDARIPLYSVDTLGAGGMYSSVHDLARFGMLHLQDRVADQARILSDASLVEMHRPTSRHYSGQGYGIGWAVRPRADGYSEVSHGGNLPGVHSIYRLVPSEHIVVSLLSNKSGDFDISDGIVDEVLKILLPKRKADQESEEEAAAPKPAFTPPPALLGRWSGTVHTYQSEVPITLEFLECGQVHAKIGSEFTALVSDVKFEDGWLSGNVIGSLGTDDIRRRHSNALSLSLKLRGTVMNGGVAAQARGLPGSIDSYLLTHWTTLKKL